MKRPKPLRVSREQIAELRERAKAGQLRPEDAELVEALAQTVVELSEAVEQKGTSIRRLLRIIFGAKTESNRRLPGAKSDNNDDEKDSGQSGGTSSRGGRGGKGKRKGHGRNGAASYTGAERVAVSHPELGPGQSCPACERGRLYAQPPSPAVYVHAKAPVNATVYECERLRCGSCGKVFTAPAPVEAAERKYDRNVGILIALMKYGAGMPFARLQNLQQMAGIPLPASVQWELVAETAEPMWGMLDELRNQAARGRVLHNDDTVMRVLELMKERDEREAAGGKEDERRGIFTTGIVSVLGTHRIALFCTGSQHAGENLKELLDARPPDAPAPIQMCDGLHRNLPADFEVLLANCIPHARRQFLDVYEAFPESCQHVIDQFAEVYRHEDQCGKEQMDEQARLLHHQTHSGPVMDELKTWCSKQLDEKLVEPNSGLGQAIGYLVRHWKSLTLFLRKPGAPLDNNICNAARSIADVMPLCGLCRVADAVPDVAGVWSAFAVGDAA